jgi:large subunit ribosomal protein L20
MNYSSFIAGLKKAGIDLDRKQLAALAIEREQLFAELVTAAKSALAAAA